MNPHLLVALFSAVAAGWFYTNGPMLYIFGSLCIINTAVAIAAILEPPKKPEPNKEEIAVIAHELWELAGRPDGRSDEFWFAAEKEYHRRSGNHPVS